ncbi:MAG: stage III sporulation protein AF [Clostridia bacterium]|nr:stage III sporulation protein AF [Clostridia bacterium]
MTETVIKLSCFAMLIGIALSVLKDGGLKNHASIGLGLVFTVSLLSAVISLTGGADNISKNGLGAALSGKLKNMLMLSEIKADTETDAEGGNAVIEKYKEEMSSKLREKIKAQTGLESTVNFIVCEDISSPEFGTVLHVYCKLENYVAGDDDTITEESQGREDIDKIEIKPDGIYVNGEPVGGDKNTSERDESEREKERELLSEAVYGVIRGFCGAEREMCSIFWEEEQ